MRDHTGLKAFQLADEVVLQIYQVTRQFPEQEKYGLVSQMRRAAVSIPSNIVEGCARESQTEYIRFLEIAFGSLKELHYQFDLSTRLGYLIDDNSSYWKQKSLKQKKFWARFFDQREKRKTLNAKNLQPNNLIP